MKKLILVLIAVMSMTLAANAQTTTTTNEHNSGKAIGVRAGSGTGTGAEFTFQQLIGSNNRVELDLGYSQNSDNYINFAAAYHWRFPIAGDFNWFIGPCVNVGHCGNHGWGLAAGAQGGAEWNPANIPWLQVAVDGRPLYDFIMDPNCYYRGFAYGVALSARYKF